MKKSLIALALVGAFSAPTFAADSEHTFAANVGVVTDYIFRGVSQSQQNPALQGGFDYSHSSGFYVGTWGSNVSWVQTGGYKDNNSLELDFYGGYKGTAGPIGYDVGVLQYYYPGDVKAPLKNTDSTEVYVGLSWEFLSLKYSHTVSSHLFGWEGYEYSTGANSKNTRGSGYIDLTANYPLEDGWGLVAHIGHQKIANNDAASYTDWKLGVTKDVGFGVVGLTYTDTDARGCGDTHAQYCWNGKDVAKGRAVLSFNKSF